MADIYAGWSLLLQVQFRDDQLP